MQLASGARWAAVVGCRNLSEGLPGATGCRADHAAVQPAAEPRPPEAIGSAHAAPTVPVTPIHDALAGAVPLTSWPGRTKCVLHGHRGVRLPKAARNAATFRGAARCVAEAAPARNAELVGGCGAGDGHPPAAAHGALPPAVLHAARAGGTQRVGNAHEACAPCRTARDVAPAGKRVRGAKHTLAALAELSLAKAATASATWHAARPAQPRPRPWQLEAAAATAAFSSRFAPRLQPLASQGDEPVNPPPLQTPRVQIDSAVVVGCLRQ